MEALARLQDKVGPFPFMEVEAIVTAELGVRLSKAFCRVRARSRWRRPRSARSTARPCATGGAVAVKVQRPGIREMIVEDLEALAEIAAFADQPHRDGAAASASRPMLEEFRKTLLRELDYRRRRATSRSWPRT